tara:strand:+ start:4962 stop:8159 length:3198 start_codon:yes stop_codon:yes gene_type:complete
MFSIVIAMPKERRDITAQHFAGAVLDPAFYDQVFHGKYDPVPFCKLTRRAWSVDLDKGCLVFDPQNGQPKQYVASADKRPGSWKNFCDAHKKGMNPIFRHFHDEFLVNKSALTTEFLKAWNAEINSSDSSVSYESLKRHFLEGDQNIDSGVQNDLYVRDWLYDMEEVNKSFITVDGGNKFYYTDEFIRTSLLDSYVTFIYLYEPWLFMEANREYKVLDYTKLWVKHYGFKSPNSFKALLRERFDNLGYVKDADGTIRLPFGKPLGFSEKIVFSPDGKKIDFEAKLTMCTSTQVRNEFLKQLKAYPEIVGLGVNPDYVWKVYPMHFALQHYDKENSTPIHSESMFFYTNVPAWAALQAELFTDAVSWAINANGAEQAIRDEEIKRAFQLPGQGDINQVFANNIALLRLGLRKERIWRTEPYSWPSNVLPIVDEATGEPMFVDKDTAEPIRFLQLNDDYVEYKNTPKWPYHCVYATSDGTTDYLLAKHAVIEREVKQFADRFDVDTNTFLISHGPVENQEYLLQHRPYLFNIEEPLIGFILYEFWALQKLDNPDVMRDVNYLVVDQDDVLMEDNFVARPLTSEEMDSPDVSGNQFQFTHQLYHGLFPYVLDNTQISNPRMNRELTEEGQDFLVKELSMLKDRMNIDGEEDLGDQRDRLLSKIEALRNIERRIVRKCTSDYDRGPHYYYNIPLSSIGDNLKVRVKGENVKHWALGSHTSCVFRMEYNGNRRELLVDANNCAVTRVSTYEELHELFDVNNAERPVAHQTQTRTNLRSSRARPFDFDFDNFKVRLIKTGDCTIPGMGDTAVDKVVDRIDLRMFPKTRVIGPPQMFQAPGMWGFVNSFLRFPDDTGASAMMIKDRKTNDSCVLLAFDNMKYIFVSNTDVQGDKFTLRQIKSHEQNDYDLLQLIRQSGGFEDISRTPGGNRFFMRAFSTTQDRTDYEPIASEKLASDRYYASNDGQHRMAHTFYDGSASGSKSECIGCFVQVANSTSVPGRDVTSSGMDATCFSSAISKRLALLRTRGGDSATHGIDGLWQCWYCNQRRETVANIDVRDGANFSFGAMHNLS